MVKMAIAEAEAHLEELVERISRTGERVTLMRGDVPLAEIVPAEPEQLSAQDRRTIVAELQRLRDRLPTATYEEVRADISEGRE